MLIEAAALALAQGPPTGPVPIEGAAWGAFVSVAGMVKWVCIAVALAGLMTIGTLLMVDNRLTDQYGPSIQAILIKVVAGLLLVAIAAQVAELFAS